MSFAVLPTASAKHPAPRKLHAEGTPVFWGEMLRQCVLVAGADPTSTTSAHELEVSVLPLALVPYFAQTHIFPIFSSLLLCSGELGAASLPFLAQEVWRQLPQDQLWLWRQDELTRAARLRCMLLALEAADFSEHLFFFCRWYRGRFKSFEETSGNFVQHEIR